MTSGKSALATVAGKYNHMVQETNIDDTTDTENVDQGFIILETNYKLYAYTGAFYIIIVRIFVTYSL